MRYDAKEVAQNKVLFAAIFALSKCAILHGQTIAGTWQGTLSAKDSQRIVFKFVEAGNNGTLRGCLIFIDRGSDGPPFLSVTFFPPDLSAVVADITYRGKLSADGKSIAGTWMQGNQTYPLMLVRATPETLWKYSGPAPVLPMAVNADPVFEVTTVKPSRGNEPSVGFKRFVVRRDWNFAGSVKETTRLSQKSSSPRLTTNLLRLTTNL